MERISLAGEQFGQFGDETDVARGHIVAFSELIQLD